MWYVAPRAGAWIETFIILEVDRIPLSRPARARGLKRPYFAGANHPQASRPARARGLKQTRNRKRRRLQRRAPRGRVD